MSLSLSSSTPLSLSFSLFLLSAELGDYDPVGHPTGYVSEFRFISNQVRADTYIYCIMCDVHVCAIVHTVICNTVELHSVLLRSIIFQCVTFKGFMPTCESCIP